MSIIRLKSLLNTAASCAPQTGAAGAIGDTVNGVGGIITGFDENPTGFDVYIQQSSGGQNSGIDVFTHGTNMRPVYNFQRGDSIRVEFARVAQFAGDTELEAPNNNFSSPNIVLRKIVSGRPLPGFFSGNTTDLNELPTNTTFAPYVSALVRLTGPVRVARVGDSNLFKACLVVRDAAPSDSVFLDFGKLTTIVPPALGTILTQVSGIGNEATRGFRIMPRDAADIIDNVPPGVSDAYSITDTQYRVVFDRDVTVGTATNTANYTLASFGTVNSAVMDGTSAVILNVTTGLLDGSQETIQVNGITGVANNKTMTTPVNSTFLAGLLTTGQMSSPNPDSLAANPCHDKSNYAGALGQFTNGLFGPRSTVTGIVTGVFGNLYYMEDPTPLSPAADHRGITVFAPPVALTLGHQYVIAGASEEFFSENEFASVQYVRDVGTPGVPAPIKMRIALASYDTCDADQNINSARDYLSELVKLQNVKVVQRFIPLPTTGFHVAGPAPLYPDTMFCENINLVLGPNVAASYPAPGTLVDVTGVIHYTTSTSTPSFRVAPRSQADIVIKNPAGVGSQFAGALSFSAFPNPARTVNFQFSLPRATQVDLGVYDIFGRHVATIATGRMEAGIYQKSWSGLNASGKQVRSGMYFYRLHANGEVRTTRTVITD